MDIRQQLQQEIARNRTLLQQRAGTEDRSILRTWKRFVVDAELAVQDDDRPLMAYWLSVLQTFS
jgi:hypothetical protein